MAFHQIDIDSGGPLTAADLDRAIAAGNTGRILNMHPILPHGLDLQGRYETRRWGQSKSDEQSWADQMDDKIKRQQQTARVVPCSTLARWYLALRRWWRG